MASDSSTPRVSLLRVLIDQKLDSNVFVATCLETGNVATASSYDKAWTMMREVLRDELLHAKQYNNLRNLFRSPAREEIRTRYEDLAKIYGTESVSLFDGAPDVEYTSRAA